MFKRLFGRITGVVAGLLMGAILVFTPVFPVWGVEPGGGSSCDYPIESKMNVRDVFRISMGGGDSTFFYTIQAGSELGRKAACHKIRTLRNSGYPAFISYDHISHRWREAKRPFKGYAIHTASFADVENARTMIGRLESKGFPAFSRYIETKSSKGWNRVYAGYYKDRRAASQASGELKQKGFDYAAPVSFQEPLFNICIGHFSGFQDARTAESELNRDGIANTTLKRNPYAVQIGSFETEMELHRIMEKLREKGWAAYILPHRIRPERKRVLAGAFREKETAARLIELLKTDGFDPKLVIR